MKIHVCAFLRTVHGLLGHQLLTIYRNTKNDEVVGSSEQAWVAQLAVWATQLQGVGRGCWHQCMCMFVCTIIIIIIINV